MRKSLIVKGLRLSKRRKSLIVNDLRNKINLAIPPVFPYLVYMTIKELQEIIDSHEEAAEGGCHQAQGQVIEAQAEIDRLKWEFHFRSWGTEDDREWRSRERNWGVEPEGS